MDPTSSKGLRRLRWILRLIVVLYSLFASAFSSISGSNSQTSGDLIDISTLLEIDSARPETISGSQDVVIAPNITLINPTPTLRTVSEGFNLLWLVSSRIHLQNRQGRLVPQPSGHRPSLLNTRGDSYSRRVHAHGLPLHSNLPKRVLRYHKTPRPHTNGTFQLTRMIEGKHIGFEMEFRVENTSGSGYLITGRSIESGGSSEPALDQNQARDTATDPESWFGLLSRVMGTSFGLRLEYRNLAWKAKRKFMVPLHYSTFNLGHWYKLAVQIDFEANTIKYWVNCSHVRVIQVQQNRTFPRTNFRIYRLLQHRNKAKMPVQVTFRSVIVTDGKTSDLPKQCFSSANVSSRECSGGRIFMNCGPSCERTCESRVTSLEGCASTCLRGCHCPPGLVYHSGQCISPRQCPCRIGSKRYSSGTDVPINNEICTCVTGKWKCYAVASFTRTPRNQTVLIGGRVNLTCGVSGNPLPRIEWQIPPGVNARTVYRNSNRKSQLFLRNVTANDAGLYTCRAARQVDGWMANATARISVTSPPVITSLPTAVTVTLGSPVASVDCVISGIPTPRAAWLKKGSNARYFTVSPGILRLKITHVNRSDAGEYKCIAINSAGRAVRSVMLLVKLPAPNSMAFQKQPQDRCVKRGHTAVFPCQVIDHGPQANVTWFKDGQLLAIDGRRIVKKRYKLVVRKVSRNDAGTYNCLVSTPTNDMQAKGRLMIKGRMLPWSQWSSCSASCGRGWMSKRRKCTGIPPNKKTCHGKLEISKFCNPQDCPGTCSSYGDPHYTTFDRREFNFQGDCGYILSQDVVGNDFEIVQYNVGCGTRLSCVRKLTVVLAHTAISAVVDINRDQTVQLNGVPLPLPFVSSNGALSIAKIGLYLVLRMADSLEIRWATPHRLYVTVSGRYLGRTQGLCGNFNRDREDDKLTPRGRLLESDLEFGQSWALKDGNANFSCSAVSTLSRPCSRNAVLAQRARDACFYLLDKSRFGECHHIVSPTTFISSCMFDICSTSIEDLNMYYCIALSAYSEECLRHGIVLDWRATDICPINCTGGMSYSECGPNCLRYCPSNVNGGKICLANKRCVSGCFCPDNKVLHNGVCIPLSQCPCEFNGMVFANGSRHNRNCQRCTCKSGGWYCVFNSMLCDYPASVARGPQAQVVPDGHSVTFCCSVNGIPTPTVEWFRNGRIIRMDLNGTDQGGGNGSHDDLNATLFLANVSERDAGSYTCKASNIHGSHHSHASTLTIVDPSMSSCDPNPSFNYVHLPEGCYVRQNRRTENVVNLGRCVGDPCYTTSSSRGGADSSCSPTQHCCQPSVTQSVLVRCRHTSYATSFQVTVVKQCACVVCAERKTLVEGVVKAAQTGHPVKHVKISYRGRTVGYTSSAGSFRINFPNLTPETRHVTITVADVMFKRFSTTIKNLLVLPGQATLHTITMRPCKLRLRFNATNGLRYTFRPSDGYTHRMRLIIPPNSLIINRLTEPYRGLVVAGISLIDWKKASRERGEDGSLPGSSIAINLNGEEQLLSPTVILCISLYSRYRRPVGLLPGKFATLSMTSNGMGMTLQPWALDDLTGYWRENGDRLEVIPHYTKRGDKVLIATARIKRLNTAWALGISQTPCYLRARVLDQRNETVPAVRVSFAAADTEVALDSRSSRNSHQRRSTKFTSYVEDLTSSRTSANGVCLPVGCHDTGMLHASRLGNELVLLEPDTPPSIMGQVKEFSQMAGNKSNYQLNSKVLDTSVIYNTTSLSSHYAYFHNKDECRDTSPALQTYVFRDKGGAHDSSVLSRYTYRNQVILTFGMPNQRHGISRPLLKYCHIKVKVQIHTSFSFHSPHNVQQSVIEVVTFRNKTTGTRKSMSMLGWRHVMLRPYSSERARDGIETQYACVEYLCGGIRLTEAENIVLHLTIRHASDNAENNEVQTLQRPRCNFTLFQPPPRLKAVSNENAIDFDYEVFEDDNFNRGGYVHVRKNTNPRSRAYRTDASGSIGNEFSARTLADSKQKCTNSLPNQHISAYFECL